MPWSWKLARIAGIDVYVHATFFMAIAWIALIQPGVDGAFVEESLDREIVRTGVDGSGPETSGPQRSHATVTDMAVTESMKHVTLSERFR